MAEVYLIDGHVILEIRGNTILQQAEVEASLMQHVIEAHQVEEEAGADHSSQPDLIIATSRVAYMIIKRVAVRVIRNTGAKASLLETKTKVIVTTLIEAVAEVEAVHTMDVVEILQAQ